MKNRLKIGLLIYEKFIPSWEFDLVRAILNSDYSIIEAVIQNEMPSVKRYSKNHVNAVFKFHKKIDHLIYLKRNNYAEGKNIFELIGGVKKVIHVSIGHLKKSSNDSDFLNEIRKLDLDIIIKLGYGKIIDDLGELTKYGLWSFPMTYFDSVDDDTIGYYEVLNRQPVIVSELLANMSKGKSSLVLTRVYEAPCAYSISLTREKLFRRASLFIPRIMKRLWEEGPEYLQKIEKKYGYSEYALYIKSEQPDTFKAFINILKATLIFIQQVYKKIIYTDPFNWILLYKPNADNFEFSSFNYYKKLEPPNDRFWADPFVIKKDNRYYVFVEEFFYKTKKGHISILELDRDGELIKMQKIIENPYHMSYPFVFERDNTYYMIPETAGNRSIDLYKCIEFPGKWERVKSIMNNINALDTTLFNYDGKWWLFTLVDNISSNLAASPELFLFWSDDFLSNKWISHPMNPVVTDVRYARPAGKIFICDGNIYRPSQDCSGRYGNSFAINQIIVLNCEEYQEKKVLKIKPDWEKSFKGTHTYNFDNGFTIIDVYKFRKRISGF